MKKLLLLFFLLLPVWCWGATLDTTLGVFSDLHHSQTNDEITGNLSSLLTMFHNEAGVTNWLGIGDIINSSTGDSGPFSSNIADLSTAFSGKTVKLIADGHDLGGYVGSDFYADSGYIYPSATFSWDIGTKWRVLGVSANNYPGSSVSATDLAWLESALTTAESDGRYVIVAFHPITGQDHEATTQTVTPNGTTGTVIITSDTAGAFATANIGQMIFLRQGTCDDQTCWGWGVVTACDGGAACTTGTTVTVASVSNAFVNTDAADEWGFFSTWNEAKNSSAIRAKLEAAGNTVVKLVLNGHSHANATWTVNGIEYRAIKASTANYGGGVAVSGALLYLYDDGTWKMAGSRGQTSYNWQNFYVNATTGNDAYSGRLVNDPKASLSATETISGASGDVVNVAAGTYGQVTITQTGTTWNFANGAIISGFVNADTKGAAWSETADANGWYTKTGVTTEPKILLRDGVLAYEGTYSADVTAATTTQYDWNGNTLYYHDGAGDAPGSHTLLISQAGYGITCGNDCTGAVFNSPSLTGFNNGGLYFTAAATATVNNPIMYHNWYGNYTSGVTGLVTVNNAYVHDNCYGMASVGVNTVAPIWNYTLGTSNGVKCLAANDGGALRVTDQNNSPLINNATLVGNYNGFRSYMDAGKTPGLSLKNIISYGNTNKGIYINGALNPSGVISYSIVNDASTWGNLTHSDHVSTSDPLFRSASDYRLRAGSPAINAGTDVGLTTDYLGKPIRGVPDIGAYEFQSVGGGLGMGIIYGF